MRNNNSNMEFSTHRRTLYWLLGLCLLLFDTGFVHAQSKRASRVTNSRSFNTNVKSTSSNGVGFDCPEEFGYYPHPTDCTQYYVCVFGGALLESCTGGLMYSHELQTCDWPRNVGCEIVDSGTSATSTELGGSPRNKAQQQQQQNQHVPSRIRFGSAFTSPAATQKSVTVPPHYHRSPPQIIQAQVQNIPPPPELRVPPNPVVTSRGQPKSVLDSQEEIAKLYAEAQETLPPVEEEENDRQQRVYRGQPSTVSQVQRDRDGIIHQASINAIPTHGKIGSYTFGTAYSESLNEDVTNGHELSHNRLDVDRKRKRREVSRQPSTTPSERANTTEMTNDSNTSSEVMEPDISSQIGSGETKNSSNNSNNSQEHFDDVAPSVNPPKKYSSKISQPQTDYAYEDIDFSQTEDDKDDAVPGESRRRPRQLRPLPQNWPLQSFRSFETPAQQPYIHKNGYSFGSFNPYLTPPSQQTQSNHNYNQLSPSPGYKTFLQQQQQQRQEPSFPFGQKPTVVYTGYNLSLPPPPLEDDFRPIAGSYYGTASSTSQRPPTGTSQAALLPYLIQQLKELKERRKQIQSENFAYFHLDNQPIAPSQTSTQHTTFKPFSTTNPVQQVTPNVHFGQYSTMGGFYNNKPEQASNTPNYPGKLVSHYSIGQGQDLQSTTESSYFQYNIIANQKMKGVYNTAKLNQIDQAAVKVRPPVTPAQVTPNFNIVSAPNLAYNKPSELQQIPYRDLPQLPIGISYASNTTMPESYQTFTKSISSTVIPKLELPKLSTTTKSHLTNFQFNINEFMANLKASDLASFNPSVNPLIKYFKQVSNNGSANTLVLRRPASSTTSQPYVIGKEKTTTVPTSLPTKVTTTRVLKGYETFVKSIQSQLNKQSSIASSSATTSMPQLKSSSAKSITTESSVEYYDDDYDDGIDEDILPPSHMPPYMPMSETVAPPRAQVTTAGPTSATPSKIRPNFQTGFMHATTTRRPFTNFSQLNQSNAGTEVPSFIRFPTDIFQELKQRLPQLQATTASGNRQTSNHIRVKPTSSSTSASTPSAPQRIRYTVRPQRTRGQQKWQTQIGENQEEEERPQSVSSRGSGYAKPGVGTGGLRGVQLNAIQSGSNTERQRVESSSPTAQTPDNIFVQPRSQAPPPQLASNRNYYNSSIFNHGGGYQTTPQAQQQQPTPFQQPQQQQQQQAQALPNPYDSSYYSVYDDDIDLYRDIEYQQQQEHQHQPQHQQQNQQPQQYQTTVRQPQQSSYRPLEILTTPTPPQRQNYNNQPALGYNTDYDEDLNSQIEQDNFYDQPTRPPQRAEEVTIQTLDVRATASTTLSPKATQDARNYYDTITNRSVPSEESAFSYSKPDEYADNAQANYYQGERTPLRSTYSTYPDDYYLIANDVQKVNSAFKIGEAKKFTKAPPPRTLAIKSSPATSRTTAKTTTTTTQTTTKSPPTTTTTKTTSTTTTLQPSSSKAHANKNFKQNVIIKLKTTTFPRTTQAPSTTTTTSSTTTPTPPPLPTYSSNPFLQTKLQSLAKSLAKVVAQFQIPNLNNTLNQTQLQYTAPLPLIAKQLTDDSANSSSSDHAETIYDESQNVHVHTAAKPSSRTFETSTSPKFLDFINAAAYGTNNLVTTSTGKSFKPEYTRDNIFNEFEKVQFAVPEESKSKRLQTYVLSDVEPQSFKVTTGDNSGTMQAELLAGSSTSRPNKAYQYSLQSGSRGFSLRAEEPLLEENASEPLFERTTALITTSKATTSTTGLPPTQAHVINKESEEIIPTTYAPLRIWRNGRPTIKQAYSKLSTLPATSFEELSSSKTTSTITPKEQTSPSTSTERFNSGQNLTTRASVFKENLNRATSNPALRFVSPYKSLESLLQDERLPQNNLRVNARTRYANAPVSIPFLQATQKSTKNYFLLASPQKNVSQSLMSTMATGNARNFSISDAILSTFSPQRPTFNMPRSTTTTTKPSTTTTTASTPTSFTTSTLQPTVSKVVTSLPLQLSEAQIRPRGRSRYTVATVQYNLESLDEPTTYAPKFKMANNNEIRSSTVTPYLRRKTHRARVVNSLRQTLSGPTSKSIKKYETYKATQQAKDVDNNYQVDYAAAKLKSASPNLNLPKKNVDDNEAVILDRPRAEALIAQQPLKNKQDNSIEINAYTATPSISYDASSPPEHVVVITDRPPVKYLYSNKYRQETAERTLAESLQNAGYITTANGRNKFRNTNVLEQLQQFLSAGDSDESGSPQFVDEFSAPEVKAAVNEIKQLYIPKSRNSSIMSTTSSTTTSTVGTTNLPVTLSTPRPTPSISKLIGNPSNSHFLPQTPTFSILEADSTVKNISPQDVSTQPTTSTSTATSTSSVSIFAPPTTRISRVNNAIKSSIAAAAAQSSSPGSTLSAYQMSGGRANKFQYGFAPNSNNNQHQYNNNNAAVGAVSVKCSDSTLSTKCNEIPSRNNNRNRGSAIYAGQDRDVIQPSNRGTHPPRTRPTLKPSGTIVSKAQEFVDIYRYPPTRPDPIYPQPMPDKTAAKCRKDVCLLPDCYCGGKEIPGDLPVDNIPQIVLLTFDDSVNDLNKQLYMDLFEKGRVNPNGCPITATFYVSHEWTDYSQVQNLYADGHEMASHTVSHSFGEQFSQKKWTREIAGQREILAAYGGVKLSDVRGMRAPFLSVGGNKMYKMLYDSNFTYDSSMPVYENRPPSWPYTLDYKIFHDCMIPPCPTRSYPGVWQVPMVMWQDLNGGRCSMGDACSNPSDAEGVTKMIMKNFERHYTTNRAPFGLFYHAAWFTQPHHKEGFIKFLDAINAMPDVWIITNWQALQWVRDPTPISRINSFQPFQCDYSDRPKRCNNPKVCNLWHKSGVRYMKTCQPCPDIYPWTGKSGIRSSRIDNEVEETPA